MMHFRGRGRRTLPINAEINITNLVDVAFVLLIIFMITAPILQGGIEVQLPEANARPLESTDAVVVSLAREGEIFVGKARVASMDELETVLRTTVGGDREKYITLKSDRAVDWGRVVEVLGLMKELDIGEVGLAIEPRARR